MALSKNERIAVYIVVFVVVAVASFFIFLLPEINKIGPNKDILAEKKAEYDGLSSELSIGNFEKIEDDIKIVYDDGKDVSRNFYETEFLSFEADKLVRDTLKEINLEIDNLIINNLNTQALSLSVFRPEDIIYGIKDKASIGNVEIPEKTEQSTTAEGEADADAKSEGESTTAPATPAAPVEEIDTSHMSDLAKEIIGLSRTQALTWYYDEMEKIRTNTNEDKTITALDIVDAMREYLTNETETVLAQAVKFEIPLTLAEATALSMHVYELDKATYIFNMTQKESEEVDSNESGGIGVVGFDDRKQLYEVEIMFMIVQPMDEPSFEYRTKFSW